MSRDERTVRLAVTGLIVALLLLVVNLAGTLWLYWANDARPVDAADVAGTATISAAMLAIVGVLGTYLTREQRKD